MNIDWDWIDSQLTRAKISQPVKTSVKRLLEVMETMNHTDDTLRQTLDAFHKLSLTHAIAADDPDENWVQCLPGEYKSGDTVRVHADAYTGAHGSRHNGKRGRVAGVRGGSTIVIYDDAVSSEDQSYHDPKKLDRLA